MRSPGRDVWLTKNGRRSLESIRTISPVPVKDSQIIEAALAEYERKVRGPKA